MRLTDSEQEFIERRRMRERKQRLSERAAGLEYLLEMPSYSPTRSSRKKRIVEVKVSYGRPVTEQGVKSLNWVGGDESAIQKAVMLCRKRVQDSRAAMNILNNVMKSIADPDVLDDLEVDTRMAGYRNREVGLVYINAGIFGETIIWVAEVGKFVIADVGEVTDAIAQLDADD
jgi:hypothetical protein